MKDLFSNIEQYKDEHGYVRLCLLPAYKKIMDLIEKMPNWVPTKEKAEKYPYKSEGSDYLISSAEIFVKRLLQNSCGKWVHLSMLHTEREDKVLTDYRDKTLMFVIGGFFYNSWGGNGIGIRYIDINGEYHTVKYKLHQLYDLAVRFCTEEECDMLGKLFSIQKPAPYLERMLVKEEYKADYKKYKADAKKYGFKPVAKCLIENCSASDAQFDKDGYIYGGKSVDVKFINI